MEVRQRVLSDSSISEFHHDNFVTTQIGDFIEICQPLLPRDGVIVDIGGGCGFFASALVRRTGRDCTVVDTDERSVALAREKGVRAFVGDALSPPVEGTEAAVCFNLILHHLVSSTESETAALQAGALAPWARQDTLLFVNEYIYDSWLGDSSGRLIYAVTASQALSTIAAGIAKIAPSLRANTFGVGVRFRGEAAWRKLFAEAGFSVVSYKRGREEGVSLARRLLLIRSCRRDSFVLSPTARGTV